jgi:8-oxo-dGTP pyrophosphatase MutT (NUDIX family)
MTETVGAVLVDAGHVLLGLRADHKSFAGYWDIIGGHLEPGETLWSALVREMAEDLGIEALEGHHLGIIKLLGASGVHVFSIRSWRGQPGVRNDEHTMIRWFTSEEASNLSNLVTPQYRTMFLSLLDE